MGLCISTAGEAASPRKPTALVLLPTDEMREYPRPATAARALEDAAAGASAAGRGAWLLCDADTMGFEGPVSAVRGDVELRAGRIYFVLPAEAGRRGMRREEVAALAVRASVALTAKASGTATTGKRRRGAVAPLVLSPPSEEEEERMHQAASATQHKRRAHHRPFVSHLSAISE